MKTLTIKDLARSEQLDRTAMAAVRGGWKMTTSDHQSGDLNFTRANDSSIHATQDLMQVQKVLNSTAIGSAFMHGVDVRNDVAQDGRNVIIG
jgi:hypothetical protein